VASFIEGESGRTRNPRSASGVKSVGTTLTTLFTLRNRLIFGGRANQVEIEPDLITLYTESTKGAQIVVYTNAILGGETNFSYVGEASLASEISTSETTAAPGTPVFEFQISANSTPVLDLSSFRLRIPPGITLTVAARVNSGAASDTGASLTWYEDI